MTIGATAVETTRRERDLPRSAGRPLNLARFLGALAKRGVIIRRDVNFLCAAHREAQVDFTINAVDGALAELGDAP